MLADHSKPAARREPPRTVGTADRAASLLALTADPRRAAAPSADRGAP
jgi:hypothetical protein